MPLPAAAARRHLHTRAARYEGFLREDGLWDIEATLSDTKTYDIDAAERGPMPAGTPVHGMSIRVTLDADMAIREIASCMDHRPFEE